MRRPSGETRRAFFCQDDFCNLLRQMKRFDEMHYEAAAGLSTDVSLVHGGYAARCECWEAGRHDASVRPLCG